MHELSNEISVLRLREDEGSGIECQLQLISTLPPHFTGVCIFFWEEAASAHSTLPPHFTGVSTQGLIRW